MKVVLGKHRKVCKRKHKRTIVEVEDSFYYIQCTYPTKLAATIVITKDSSNGIECSSSKTPRGHHNVI